jgi:hypothetical protein
MMKIDATDYFN